MVGRAARLSGVPATTGPRQETREAPGTPDYGPFGKRPTMSNGFIKAFNRENTQLVTTPIERFTAGGSRPPMAKSTPPTCGAGDRVRAVLRPGELPGGPGRRARRLRPGPLLRGQPPAGLRERGAAAAAQPLDARGAVLVDRHRLACAGRGKRAARGPRDQRGARAAR